MNLIGITLSFLIRGLRVSQMRCDVPDTLKGYYFYLWYKGKRYSLVNFVWGIDTNHDKIKSPCYHSWEILVGNKDCDVARGRTMDECIDNLVKFLTPALSA